MGGPMAGHLLNAGHSVVAYNRSPERGQAWLKENPLGKLQTTAKAAASNAEFVVICVGNDDDLRSVFYGDNGVLAGLSANSLIIDHTTASAKVAKEIDSTCQKHGAAFIDAPVSGGQAGAENAALSIMVGGAASHFERACPILAPYTKAIRHLGPTGSGQLCKMVNQICAAGAIQGLAEGIAFGEKAGLNMDAVMEVVSQGAAGSWQMSNRSETMLADEFEFGFAVDWMRKDLDICLATAKETGAQLPLTEQINQRYTSLQKIDGGRWDTSALIKLLR